MARDKVKNSAKEPMATWKKVLIGIGIFLLIVYVAGVAFFHWHFQYQTTLNGHKVDFKNANDVKKELTESVSDFDLELKERENKTEQIKAKDIDVRLEYNYEVYKALRSQNEFLWFIDCFKKKDQKAEADISYNSEKLNKLIDELACMDKKKDIDVVNAKVEYKDGKYQIIKEVDGTEVDKDGLKENILKAFKKNETVVNMDKDGSYKAPTIRSTDKVATDALRTAQKYAGTKITYKFADKKEVVDKKLIHKWIKVDKKLNVSLDYDKVLDYIEELAGKYDTYQRSVKLKSHSGSTVTVPAGGTYGWKISETKEAKRLMQLIEQGRSLTKEPKYLLRAEKGERTSINANTKTYIEISISAQHMWAYKNGECIVSTDVVTGDVVRGGRSTNKGAYYIIYKQSPAVLRGSNNSYASPVTFWMPFNGEEGEGIHDSSWRSSYGGSIYRGNGSHGCVNTPYSAARKIYNNFDAGTPVFVY